MTEGIGWSGNGRLYLRSYPAWHTLYRELSRGQLTRAKAARVLGVDELFIQERQKIPGLINRDKIQFSIVDLIALAILIDFKAEPQKMLFLERMLHDYESFLWQAAIGIFQGVDVFIAADFDKTIVHPYFHIGTDEAATADDKEIPIPLKPYFQKLLIDRAWPHLQVKISTDGAWTFEFQGHGYLQLDTLSLAPSDGHSSSRPAEPAQGDRDEHGHKRLSIGNHLELDPFFSSTTWWSNNIDERTKHLNERIDEILAISMHPSVPADVRKMFDLLKGGMIYGFYYRPLFSLLGDQVYFIADAALHHKCKELKIDDKGWNFKKRIAVLKKVGTIHTDEGVLWDAMLELRDSVAHQTHRPLNWPPNEVAQLETVADDVSRLFLPLFAAAPPAMGRPFSERAQRQ